MVSDHGNLRRIFQEGFSARDIAQALPSFDGTARCQNVQSIMAEKGWEVVGVRIEGIVSGFADVSDLIGGCCGDVARRFDVAELVPENLPLAPLVLRLKDQSRLFVETLGQVGGVVTRFDMQKPAGRMWLFGMVTLIEMRFGRLIEQHCPGETWKEFLSEGRIQKSQDLLAERRRRGQQVSLTDCLQFADKVRIIGSSELLRRQTRFASKRQIEDVGKQLETLRNNLAHAQDIVPHDWDTIVALAEQLDSVLDGPQAAIKDAT
jgi:hypothetical protein